MRFTTSAIDEPHVDLVSFIDVLLVILIFLMLTTTYSRFTELHLNLPPARAAAAQQRAVEVTIAISADDRDAVNNRVPDGHDATVISGALEELRAGPDIRLVITAAPAAAPPPSSRGWKPRRVWE